MSRRNPKRRMTGQHFAAIPVEVLQSDAARTLSNASFRVLIAIAAQYRGRNNGDLALTRSIAKTFGINRQENLVTALAELQERGLIVKTRQGGKKPLGPTLYAVTWQRVDDLGSKIEHGPTMAPAHAWATWKPSAAEPKPAKAKINDWVRRGTRSGPLVDQTRPILGPLVDQRTAVIGSAGGPPSRISPEGHALRARRNRPPASKCASESPSQSRAVDRARKLLGELPHLTDRDVARIAHVEPDDAKAARQSLEARP